MNVLRAIACVALLALQLSAAAAFHHGLPLSAQANSQVSLYILSNQTSEYPFLNSYKTAGGWSYCTGGTALRPDEMDINGYPLTGAAWASNGGACSNLFLPSQAERPGHYTLIWTGQGVPSLVDQNGVATTVSCTGTASAGPSCSNMGCSTFTGYIAGTTLTVPAAPTGSGCTLGQGIPFTGSGVTVSTFGTPTIITSSGSSCGGNTCYTVNISQTAGSSGSPLTLTMGGRFEVSSAENATSNANWNVNLGTTSGNTSNYALLFAGTGLSDPNSDEPAFWASATPCGHGQACIVGALFKKRIQQGNFAIMRDLDWAQANTGICTTWSSRKSILFSRYAANEYRNAVSGTETYVAAGHTYTIPHPGQYVNSGGTGASAGTVSYNAGLDEYDITLGTGAPVDKQTLLMLPPSTGTQSSKINLNATGAITLLSTAGGTPIGSSAVPTATKIVTLVYDAVLNGWLTYGGTSSAGINCGVPPEVFIEINAELNTTPWHTLPWFATDPMTDWTTQLATYEKANYPSAGPVGKFIYESTNEPFNCNTNAPIYFSNKSAVYVAEDSAWHNGGAGAFCGGGGNNPDEVGKIGSTVGQDLVAVFGAGNYELAQPTQTYVGSQSTWAHIFTSTDYLAQTIAPTQTGYSQTAAYQYATRLSVNDYWNVGAYGNGNITATNTNSGANARFVGVETGLAYCYYNYSISATCQGLYVSQAAVMTAYMNTSTSSSCGSGITCSPFNLPFLVSALQAAQTMAQQCGTGGSAPGNCTVNQTHPLLMYEGGYNESGNSVDYFQSIAGAIPGASTTGFIVHNSGCVVGQPISLSGLTGGTWSSANGSYTVQSVSGEVCNVSLNSSGLGTFGTISTTASGNWTTASTTISVASCTSIANGQTVSDTTSGKYVGTVSGCSTTTLTLNAAAVNAGSNGDTLAFISATSYLTYTGSTAWINSLRANSYLAPELDTLTTAVYNDVINNGGQYPSQYQLAAPLTDQWLVWGYDLYGYYQLATSTSSSISGTTLTLGGTITGIFGAGQTLFGNSVTGLNTGAGSNTTIISCTAVGANVAGTTAGDTCTLSQASTSTNHAMDGYATPPANNANNSTTSPIRAWGAICRWNGNGSQC